MGVRFWDGATCSQCSKIRKSANWRSRAVCLKGYNQLFYNFFEQSRSEEACGVKKNFTCHSNYTHIYYYAISLSLEHCNASGFVVVFIYYFVQFRKTRFSETFIRVKVLNFFKRLKEYKKNDQHWNKFLAVKNEGWSPFDPSAWALPRISFGSKVWYKKK